MNARTVNDLAGQAWQAVRDARKAREDGLAEWATEIEAMVTEMWEACRNAD